MAKNFRIYLIYLFILLVIFTSLSWSITNKLIYKKNFLHTKKNFFSNLVVLFFYLLLIFLFFFSLFNITITEVVTDSTKILTKYIPFLILSLILVYFMFVSLSLLYHTNLKSIVQKTLVVGIKKFHYIFAVCFINIFLFGIYTFFLIYFIEKNLFFLLLSMLMIIFSFIFGRIFLANVVEKLKDL